VGLGLGVCAVALRRTGAGKRSRREKPVRAGA
jgi:hypothetical protein